MGLRAFAIVMATASLTLMPRLIASAASTNASESDIYENQFREQQQQLLRMRDDLQRSIEAATAAMKGATEVDLGKVKVENLRKPYLDFRTKIQGLLNMFDDQGDFATSIDGAQAAATRALAWWKRQPADDEQQKIVKDLEASIQQYENAEHERLRLKDDANRQLNSLLARQLQMERIAQTDRIIDASRQIGPVLSGMAELTKALGDLANPTVRPGS
jgi:hypothetical protein